MATNYTANYGLCQWEPQDNFLRTEFNQDNAKIDAALAGLESGKADNSSVDTRFASVTADLATLRATDATKADSSSVSSQFSSANSRLTALEGRVEVIVGSYTGDGAETRTISLGFTPKAVLLEHNTGMRVHSTGVAYGGLALPNTPASGLKVVDGGFEVYYFQNSIHTNNIDTVYRYLAFKQV